MFRTVWSALALAGAGLILFALAAGLHALLAAPLIVLAVSQLVFGGVLLRTHSIPVPRTLLGLCAVTTAASLALVFGGLIGFVPVVALLLFQWGVAITAALQLRNSAARQHSGGGGRMIAALVSGAIVVATITTPALSLTEPGSVALPHGVHHHQ